MSRNADPPDGTLAALRERWRRLPVLPVLRTSTSAEAIAAAEQLVESGVGVLELTSTTAGWEEATQVLLRDHPEVVVGLGTVRDADTARRAEDAGLAFLVSPHPVPGVREAVGVPLVEGGWSPAELAGASAHGIAKLFPAHVGGTAYLRTVRAVLPDAEIVPTGGIEPADVEEWLDAGALAVGLGSSLTAALSERPEETADWFAGLAARSTP